jgi:hypothetical protein
MEASNWTKSVIVFKRKMFNKIYRLILKKVKNYMNSNFTNKSCEKNLKRIYLYQFIIYKVILNYKIFFCKFFIKFFC